ncbi:MAG: histidine kinase dimerization/phospho-acceptor domain-containing protein, partial [Gammaproteobacteria bacterium]
QLQEATGQVATIIARHRASRAMSEAREAAEDAVRMQREFLGMISHEMRTPLNGVIGLAQVLQNSSLDAQQ